MVCLLGAISETNLGIPHLIPFHIGLMALWKAHDLVHLRMTVDRDGEGGNPFKRAGKFTAVIRHRWPNLHTANDR